MAEQVPCPKCAAGNFPSSPICWQCGTPMKRPVSQVQPPSTPYPDQNANYMPANSPYPTVAPSGPPPTIALNNVQQTSRPAVILVAAILGLGFYGLRLLGGIVIMIGGFAMGGSMVGLGAGLIALSGLGIAAGVRLLQGYAWARSWLMGLSGWLLIATIIRFGTGRSTSPIEDGLSCAFAVTLLVLLNLPGVQDYCAN